MSPVTSLQNLFDKINANTANMKIVHNVSYLSYRNINQIFYGTFVQQIILFVINLYSDANKRNIIMSVHLMQNLSK